MHVVFRESHGLEETATPCRSRPGSGRSRRALVLRQRSRGLRSRLAARARQPAEPAARQSRRAAPSALGRYLCRATLRAGARRAGAADRRRDPIGLTVSPPCISSQNSAASRSPCCRPTAATIRGSMRSRPCRVSTLRQLKALCDTGGAVAAQAAIAQLALASGLYAGPVLGELTVPEMGFYDPARGVLLSLPASDGRPPALVTFYRSYLTAADTGAGRCADRRAAASRASMPMARLRPR